MRRMRGFVLVALASALSCDARSADIINGWSAPGSITKIHSLWSSTLFRLSSTANGCGHPDLWALTVQDTPASKGKLAMLLSAYMSGKTVALRCENSQVTDFEIVD